MPSPAIHPAGPALAAAPGAGGSEGTLRDGDAATGDVEDPALAAARREAGEAARTYEHELRRELTQELPVPPATHRGRLAVAVLVLAVLALGAGLATFLSLRHRHRAERTAEAVTAARLGVARGSLGALREAARVLSAARRDTPDDQPAAELEAQVAALLAHDFGERPAAELARGHLDAGRAMASAPAVRWLLAQPTDAAATSALVDGSSSGPPLARALAGELLLARGDLEGARPELQAAAAAAPPQLRAAVALGELALAEGDAEAALEQELAVLRAVPRHPTAALAAAEVRLTLGTDLGEALRLLQEVEADPDVRPPFWARQRFDLAMARLLAATGRSAEAERRVEAAADRDVGPAVGLARAEVKAAAGDLDGAIAAAEEARKRDPRAAAPLELLARLQLRRGLYQEVLAATVGATSRRLRIDRAMALLSLEQPDRASAELEATRRQGRMAAEAAAWMAVAEVARGRKAEAAELCGRLLTAPHPHPVALLARARLDLLEREAGAAEQHFRAALAGDAELAPARVGLARVLLASARAAEARELLAPLVSWSPWNEEARRLLDRAERESGSATTGAAP